MKTPVTESFDADFILAEEGVAIEAESNRIASRIATAANADLVVVNQADRGAEGDRVEARAQALWQALGRAA